MSPSQWITRVSERTGASQEDTERALMAAIEVIADALTTHDVFRMPTFGTILVADQKPRRLRNPQSGELMMVPAKKRIIFRASDVLKAAVQPKPKPKKKTPAAPATKPGSRRHKPKMSTAKKTKKA